MPPAGPAAWCTNLTAWGLSRRTLVKDGGLTAALRALPAGRATALRAVSQPPPAREG